MSCKYETYGCRYRHCMTCEHYKTPNVTIKEYNSTPDVLIDRRAFVDKEMFVGYALNLLQQEINVADSYDERLGLELAKNIIRNIR